MSYAPPPDQDRISRRREAIEYELVAALDAARARFEEAKQAHRKVLLSNPVPFSPEALRLIGEASDEHQQAMQSYAAALREFEDFILEGVVPPDLREIA